MADLPALFDGVATIQLYDWPHQEVPGILLRAGFTVYGHAPDGYHVHKIADVEPDAGRAFPVAGDRWLVAHGLDGPPPAVDLVCTFRPPDEQPDIVRMAIELGAKTFWVQEPAEPSEDARLLAEQAGLNWVDSVAIEQVVSEFQIKAKGSA